MTAWLEGLTAAEAQAERAGRVFLLPPNGTERVKGWNDYVMHRHTHMALSKIPERARKRLARIEQAYNRAVLNISYASHTEFEVLSILQRLQTKRNKLICKVYVYELTRN